ncbi:Protein of unknown function [Gryllus bimaculatus]|nr:Protein of unknown function [Gryllus bimaculatus]
MRWACVSLMSPKVHPVNTTWSALQKVDLHRAIFLLQPDCTYEYTDCVNASVVSRQVLDISGYQIGAKAAYVS